jgi:hypothetical protein
MATRGIADDDQRKCREKRIRPCVAWLGGHWYKERAAVQVDIIVQATAG